MRKFMSKLLVSVSLLLLALSGGEVGAAMLQLKSGDKAVDGVAVVTSATAALAGGSVELATVGASERLKFVPILGGIRIYVGQFLVSDTKAFVRSSPASALDSLGKMQSVAALFTFKYGLTPTQISDAFHDMLQINNVDLNAKPVSDFLTMIGTLPSVNKGESLAVIGERLGDGTEKIYLQFPDGSVKPPVVGPSGFVKMIFNFWFGQTHNDKGLEQFKQDIVKGANI